MKFELKSNVTRIISNFLQKKNNFIKYSDTYFIFQTYIFKNNSRLCPCLIV